MKSTDTQMTRINLDLTRNLTEKRIPTEMRGFEAYRLIIWDIDPDTGSRSVQDIFEGVGKFAIYFFNKSRTRWYAEGLQVSLERAVYS